MPQKSVSPAKTNPRDEARQPDEVKIHQLAHSTPVKTSVPAAIRHLSVRG